jgi:peptidoglycan/xylan/chitin deacetylase (PgdA/CDA1 family)
MTNLIDGDGAYFPKYGLAPDKSVYITFDDGPHSRHTQKVLEVLRSKGILATFFVLGINVERNGSELLKRAKDEGHCIGNHTYSHPDLTLLTEQGIKDEILKCQNKIQEFMPRDKRVFRPPYGKTNNIVAKVLSELGYSQVLWTVDTLDWDPNYQPKGWIQHGTAQIRNLHRSVVLNHDIQGTTANNFAEFIDNINSIGTVTFKSWGSLT